jgi:hypothetical protein
MKWDIKQKPWLRVAVMAGCALALAGALAALVILVIVPAAKYGKAGKLLSRGEYADAYDAYDLLGGYRDAAARKAKLQEDALASRAAQTMELGGYVWLVLEERDGKALLLLRDILEKRPYHEPEQKVTWEACQLRGWLNGAFYQSFDPPIRARIVEMAVANRPNAQYRTKAGNDTVDYIFLLSLAQAKLYFPDDAARAARNADGSGAWWWLRSPGLSPRTAAIVTSEGALGTAGSGVDYYDRGVRPAMWVTAEKE